MELKRIHPARTALLLAVAVNLFAVLGNVPAQTAPASTNASSLASLQQRLAAHLDQPRFAAASWGVKIVSLDTGATLFDRNAGKLHKPASNAKLYTGALALDRLGPDFRIRTTLYTTARPNAKGVVKGNLIVYGRGDPTFAARFHQGDHTKSLEPLVDAVLNAGVKHITGDLIGDESFFRGPPFGASWTWNDLQDSYGAGVSALTAEDNTIDLILSPGDYLGAPCRILARPDINFLTFINRATTSAPGSPRQIDLYRPLGESVVHVTGHLPLQGSDYTDAVAVPDPARWFMTLLRAALVKHGIKVGGRVRTVNWIDRELEPFDESQWVELATVQSRPLSEILPQMLKPSQNLYAQLLLLQVGARRPVTAIPAPTAEAAGLAELSEFLGEVGVRKGDVLLDEGSGLSRAALLTPDATIALLRRMDRHRHAGVFRDSLPLAGVDGTLRNRMKGTAAEKNVRAKTGTIRYVNALSGYVTTAVGERLAFSIMRNNYQHPDPQTPAAADLDAIAVMLAELAEHSRTAASSGGQTR